MAEEPFWPAEKNSSASKDLAALQVAHFRGQALDGRGDHPQGGEIHGVPVPGNDLGRDGLHLEAHPLGHVFLDPRVDVGEGADGPRDGAGGDLPPRLDEAHLAAFELRIGPCQLEAEGGGLRMDAVGPADGGRHLVLEGAAPEGGQKLVEVPQQQVGGAGELHVEGGVEHVRGGHALVHEPGFGADDLGQMREERDDVVLDLALDGVDALHVEGGRGALLPHGPGRFPGHHAEIRQRRGRVSLDLEPDAELGLRRPDGHHLGAAVARDHYSSPAGKARSSQNR
jgi:hypothetical protein